MASKLCVFSCLKCGEYIKGTMNEAIAQFEIHMCNLCSTQPDEKQRKILEVRQIFDEEIAKITQETAPPPPPPPMPLPPQQFLPTKGK